MGLFINNNGSWVEMTADKPIYTKVSSTWRFAFKMFYKDGSTWKQVYVGDTTPPTGDVTSVTGADRWKNTMTVNYSAAADDYTGVAVYKLQVNINDAGWNDIPNLNLNTSGSSYNYDSTNAGSNAKVQFRTKKVDGAGNEGFGTPVTQYRDDTGPSIQVDPTVSASGGTLTYTHRGVTDSSSGVKLYYAQIERDDNPGVYTNMSTSLDQATTSTNTSKTWTISSTYKKKNIRVRLYAEDNAGNPSYRYSSWFQLDNVDPTPGSITISGNTTLSLVYGSASDSGSTNHTSGLSTYSMEHKVDSGSWSTLYSSLTTSGSSKNYAVPAADYNKTHYFRTKAVDVMGNDDYSAEVSRYVDTTKPTGLTNYTPTLTANGNNMDFTYPAVSDTTGVSSYVLQIYDVGFITAVSGLSTSGGTGTYNVPDGKRGNALLFRLYAVDDRGNFTASNDATFQTRPKGDFYFNPSGHGTVSLPTNGYTAASWSNLSDEVHSGWVSSFTGNQHGFFFYGTQLKDACKGFAPDSATLVLTRSLGTGCSGVTCRVSTTSLGSQSSNVPSNSGGWLTIGQNDPYYATFTNPTVGNSVTVTLTSNMRSKIASNAQSSFMIHPNATTQSTSCPGTTYVVLDSYKSSDALRQFAGFVTLTFN